MITKDKVTKRQAEKARSAIQSGQIIARLQSSILGEPAIETCECGKEYEVFNISEDTLKKMSPSDVRAGLGLISHVLPKPQEITISDMEGFDNESTDQKMLSLLRSPELRALWRKSGIIILDADKGYEISELEKYGIRLVKPPAPSLKAVV